MVEYFNNKAGVSDTLPLGCMNSAFGLSGSRESDSDTTKALYKDGVIVPLAKVQLTNCPLILSDSVKRALPMTWDPPALARYLLIIKIENYIGRKLELPFMKLSNDSMPHLFLID